MKQKFVVRTIPPKRKRYGVMPLPRIIPEKMRHYVVGGKPYIKTWGATHFAKPHYYPPRPRGGYTHYLRIALNALHKALAAAPKDHYIIGRIKQAISLIQQSIV